MEGSTQATGVDISIQVGPYNPHYTAFTNDTSPDTTSHNHTFPAPFVYEGWTKPAPTTIIHSTYAGSDYDLPKHPLVSSHGGDHAICLAPLREGLKSNCLKFTHVHTLEDGKPTALVSVSSVACSAKWCTGGSKSLGRSHGSSGGTAWDYGSVGTAVGSNQAAEKSEMRSAITGIGAPATASVVPTGATVSPTGGGGSVSILSRITGGLAKYIGGLGKDAGTGASHVVNYRLNL